MCSKYIHNVFLHLSYQNYLSLTIISLLLRPYALLVADGAL